MTDNFSQPATQPQKKKAGRGDFFIIDIDVWKNLYNDLLQAMEANPIDDTKATRILASYLVLACGTGGDNITTRWSATACYNYAGFSNQSGKVAIECLIQLGYITIKEKPATTKSQNNTYKLIRPDKGNEIYLPKSLIMGVNGEMTPLKRLYIESNPHLLYLFIRLYKFQYKTLDIIDPDLVSSLIINYDEGTPKPQVKLFYNESNLLNVWGVSNFGSSVAKGKSDFFDFSNQEYLFKQGDSKGVWGFYKKLESLGLMTTVCYACMGKESTPAEIDTICETGSLPQGDYKHWISNNAKNKGFNYDVAKEDSEITYTVVLSRNYQDIHFAIFQRLTYRTNLGDNMRFDQERHNNAQILSSFKRLSSMDQNFLAEVEKEYKNKNLI